MNRLRGVTLIELIVVIAITGIIAAGVALFIRRPVESYVDAARRATLTDVADTALRRMTRDLRLALPNSVRVSGTFIEYIETSGGGRYRAELDSGGLGNILDFSAADSSFDVIGPLPAITATTNAIVVYNLYNTGATSNAYSGDNRQTAAASGVATVNLTVAKQFPAPSPGRRFHVVTGPVTYGCTGGQLLRYSGYGYNEPQVAPPTGGGITTAVLATNVGDCQFVYTAGTLTERTGTVSIILQINSVSAGGDTERVRMFQQAQVSNAP